MEHFILPAGKRHTRVPNLTNEKYTYSGEDFESYPERCGWTSEDLHGGNGFGGRSTEDVAAFFQSWLYFGFVKEVLVIADVRFKMSLLLSDDRKFVSSRKLPSLIRKWGHKVWNMRYKPNYNCLGWDDNPSRMEWAIETGRVIKRVSEYVERYCTPHYDSVRTTGPASGRNPLPEKVWMSIIALGHTLSVAARIYYEISGAIFRWGSSTLLERRMPASGWCPMDVGRALAHLGIDGHYYMSKLGNQETHVDHRECDRDECRARNIDEGTYKQRHVVDGCTCETKGVDQKQLVKIIEDGGLPVYSFDMEKRIFEIKSSKMIGRGTSDPPYVAISHVWSDGMGNPIGNDLISCQCARIQRIIDASSTHIPSDTPVRNFWMDTLCVPVGDSQHMKDLRLLCIRLMARIYKSASAVVVISSTLQNISTESRDADKAMALFLCNWNTRLWTFQEGMLAKTLLFNLSDAVIPIDDIRQNGSLLARGHCIDFPGSAIGRSNETFMLLRSLLRSDVFRLSNKEYRSGPLLAMVSGMQQRSTTRKSDETICAGTILGLKIEKLQEVGNQIKQEYIRKGLQPPGKIPEDVLAERRMEKFYTMVRVFPADIVFSPHRRLNRDGFRWAPASLIGTASGGFARHWGDEKIQAVPVFDKSRGCLKYKGPGFVFTTSDIDTASGHRSIVVEVPRGEDEEPLKLRITTRPTPEHPDGLRWIPGTAYGVIVSKPVDEEEYVTDFNDDWYLNMTPGNRAEMTQWFKRLYPESKVADYTVDAAMGIVKGFDEVETEQSIEEMNEEKKSNQSTMNEDDNREKNNLQTVQAVENDKPGNEMPEPKDVKKTNKRWDNLEIRHECIGTVTLLNPKAILQMLDDNDYDENSDPATTSHKKISMKDKRKNSEEGHDEWETDEDVPNSDSGDDTTDDEIASDEDAAAGDDEYISDEDPTAGDDEYISDEDPTAEDDECISDEEEEGRPDYPPSPSEGTSDLCSSNLPNSDDADRLSVSLPDDDLRVSEDYVTPSEPERSSDDDDQEDWPSDVSDFMDDLSSGGSDHELEVEYSDSEEDIRCVGALFIKEDNINTPANKGDAGQVSAVTTGVKLPKETKWYIY